MGRAGRRYGLRGDGDGRKGWGRGEEKGEGMVREEAV